VFGLVLYPLLTALTPRVEPLVFYAALAGIFGAGLNLVLFDISLSTAPPERTAAYIALCQLTTYIATLVAPLVGTLLADCSDTRRRCSPELHSVLLARSFLYG